MSVTTQSFPSNDALLGLDFQALSRSISNIHAAVMAGLNRLFAPRQVQGAEAAAQLRDLAASYAESQPSFAADLAAAADRYEAQAR